jgi:hypothetical protein
LDIAAAPSGHTAVATRGGTFLFDIQPTTTSLIATNPRPSSHVELSADGATLVASADLTDAQPGQDISLRVYDWPSTTPKKTYPYVNVYPGELFVDFSLSDDGTRLGQLFVESNNGYRRQVTDLLGTNTYFSDTPPEPSQGGAGSSLPPPLISPSGSRIGAVQGVRNVPGVATNLYANNTLVGAVDGYGVGWLDDNRLLVNVYAYLGKGAPLGGFQKAQIYDAQGNLVATPPLPEMYGFQMISANVIYSKMARSIFDINTGALLWGSGGNVQYFNFPSAVTKTRAVISVDHRVEVLAHP